MNLKKKKSHWEYLVDAFWTSQCGSSSGPDEEEDLRGRLNKGKGQPNG